MFSVIIPLYNKAPYIEKALQSVLQQTFRDFEIIVVDDGSTDNGAKIVKNIFSPHYLAARQLQIPLKGFQFISQPNQGVSTARNNGVKAAQGEYIVFLDADDWWNATFLEEMKILIDQFPEAGIYGSSYFKVKDGKNIPAQIGVENGFTIGLINYFQVYAKTLWMPLTSISVVIPKDVYTQENGFNPNIKLGEDFDLWVRIASKFPVAFLNRTLAYYNQDIDKKNRAVGDKFYRPREHFLFSDYQLLQTNEDFKFLYDRLTLYGLLPYYLRGINAVETDEILKKVNWEEQEFKYRLYYKILPRTIVKNYFSFLKVLYQIKRRLWH
jgi:glycosyltransferase involved in cell wall biosynthesis